MIDVDKLPRGPVAVDTGVFMRAIGDRADEKRSKECSELAKALLDNGRTILLPAHALAEVLIKNAAKPPSVKGIEIGAFDAEAARTMGASFPATILTESRAESGGTWEVVRSDAFIVATAKRHGASAFVSLDLRPWLRRLCEHIDLPFKVPEDFLDSQGTLPLE